MDEFKKVKVNSLYYRLARAFFGALGITTVLSILFGALPAIGAKSWNIFFVIYGVIFTLAFLWGAIKSLLEYLHLKYKIADQSVSFRSGMLSVNTATIPFAKITNASFFQSLLARLFSVGNINIDQEDSSYSFIGVDRQIGDEVLDVIAKKSNIQPMVSASK